MLMAVAQSAGGWTLGGCTWLLGKELGGRPRWWCMLPRRACCTMNTNTTRASRLFYESEKTLFGFLSACADRTSSHRPFAKVEGQHTDCGPVSVVWMTPAQPYCLHSRVHFCVGLPASSLLL